MKLRTCAVLLALAACDRGVSKKNLARITADPSAIDFGPLAPGAAAAAKATLKNGGEAALHTTSAALHGDPRPAFARGTTPATLEVGATVEVTVTYVAPLVEGVDGAS